MLNGVKKNYQSMYYSLNKERLQSGKKLRYRTDPEYRKRMIAASKLAYIFNQRPLESHTNIAIVNGKKEPVLLVPQLSQYIGRHHTVIRRWRDRGYLPKPTVKDDKKRDKYTISQAKYIKAFVDKVDKGELECTYEEMKTFLDSVWDLPFDPNKLLTGGLSETKK